MENNFRKLRDNYDLYLWYGQGEVKVAHKKLIIIDTDNSNNTTFVDWKEIRQYFFWKKAKLNQKYIKVYTLRIYEAIFDMHALPFKNSLYQRITFCLITANQTLHGLVEKYNPILSVKRNSFDVFGLLSKNYCFYHKTWRWW